MSTLDDHYIQFEGSDDLDFVPVVDVDLGESYEWDEFHAWYSPSRRAYFWASGAGCSCNSFADDLRSLDDFENGRARADVMAALNRYFDGQYYDRSQQRADALYTVNAFRPTEATR
ncbi:hypothetical protein [Microbacterium sp. PM5]|uniref:DUF7574 domain-containing protein n=1 Tax=Microbacterium sp. PM5 TaxID=2014534 RepID=UPI000DD10CAE|nr:hypothetical protein [Microbacterium sp. PM5]AXA97611.1 hypothetical protein CEP17_14940 [Microbacterium sp. PM5]